MSPRVKFGAIVFLAKQLRRLDYSVNLCDGRTFTHKGSGTTFGKNPKTPFEFLFYEVEFFKQKNLLTWLLLSCNLIFFIIMLARCASSM